MFNLQQPARSLHVITRKLIKLYIIRLGSLKLAEGNLFISHAPIPSTLRE